MSKLFIPYIDDSPAAIEIKGHKVLLLTTNLDSMEEELEVLGGNEVREMEIYDDGTAELAELAESISGGVVLTPPGVSVSTMINSLEQELQWMQ